MEKALDRQGRWRSKTVAFRVSPEENNQIEIKVRLSGLTKQDYIVSRLTDREIRVVGNPRVYKALKNQMADIYAELQRLTSAQEVAPDMLETLQMIAHVDCGDNVIIINADKVKMTGNKWTDKVYLSYTGYPGGQREMTPARLQAKPNGDDRLLRKVVKGMLHKNKLGAKLMSNMYVYAGSEHKHDAQNPKTIDINLLK